MVRNSLLFAATALLLGACGGHETPASDAQVVTAEARAERSDVVEQCMEDVNDRYESAIDACDDDVCKSDVEIEKVRWYEACK
jgi:hypothetical protein